MADERSRTEPRPLGASGVRVSPIGLGLAAVGRPAYINLGRQEDLGDARRVEAMETRTHAVLDEAWRLGVRYVDAARSYGRAEVFLGGWLGSRGIGPGDVVVGSKWGYAYTGDWRLDAETHEVKDLSLSHFAKQYAETRERLGEQLELYQAHSVTLESGMLEDRRLLAALAALKDQGVLVGLTTSGPAQAQVIARTLEVRVDGVRVFDTVQATWNLFERSAEPALAEARAAGLGVIVKEALANGRLTARNLPAEAARHRARLEAQAERLGTTVDALALAAALERPWADVVLSGAVSVEQVRSNLAALGVALDEEAKESLDRLVGRPEAYWTRRAALSWR